jgi:hypothetical protein
MFRGRFIQRSKGFRGDRDAARVEARVFAFFSFALALGIADVTSSWPPAPAIIIAIATFACAAPFVWYVAWSLITFLGFAPFQAPVSGGNRSRGCVRCRSQCRLAAARLDAFIARVEASAHAAAAGGSSMSVRRASGIVEDTVLSDYATDCEDWVLDILVEAWKLGASIPGSVKSRLVGRTVGDLRVLSVVLRELEDELGEIAASD